MFAKKYIPNRFETNCVNWLLCNDDSDGSSSVAFQWSRCGCDVHDCVIGEWTHFSLIYWQNDMSNVILYKQLIQIAFCLQ